MLFKEKTVEKWLLQISLHFLTFSVLRLFRVLIVIKVLSFPAISVLAELGTRPVRFRLFSVVDPYVEL